MLPKNRIEQLKEILLAKGKEKGRLVAQYLYLNYINPEGDSVDKVVWPDEEDTPSFSFEGLLLLAEVWITPSLPIVSAEKLELADVYGNFWTYMDSILKDVLYRLGGEDASYAVALMEEDFI